MGREKIKIREYFSGVETIKEHNGYFCSVGEALTSDIGFNMRLVQYQSNPSMGVKPACQRVFVGAFSDKYHPVLLLAIMPVKADKARIA